MEKKLSAFTGLLLGVFFLISVANAQTSAVQKAVENVKDRVDDLVQAKDENDPASVALRIEAFKKVLELSITETKSLKVKFLSLDLDEKDEALSVWKEKILGGLNDALSFYNKQREFLTNNEDLSLGAIKEVAENFKTWREKIYLPLVNQINDFLLIDQEESAIETAERRAKKIGDDVAKLQKSRIGTGNLNNLKEMLKRAEGLIDEGGKLNEEARTLYLRTFILPPPILDSTSTTTSTKPIVPPPENSSTTTSTAPIATEGEAVSPIIQPSIRDLVKTSLAKVKESYQIFIEMSNLVRKLLG